MTDKPQPEAFCWATELAMVRDPVTLTVKEAREVSDEMQRMHAELETLRAGYDAARLEIESLKAQSAAQRWNPMENGNSETALQMAAVIAHRDAALPDAPLPVFSKGPWTFKETGQSFSGAELDEAAFVAYRDRASHGQAPAAQQSGEQPLPLLVRDIAADLATTPIQVCMALSALGFGGHSVNMVITPTMAQALRAHFSATAQAAPQQEAASVDLKTMELAESVGLIGPASRTHDLHAAVQRFHDLICVNATIKAAVMAADAIRGAATSARDYPPLPMQFACSGVFPVYSADQMRAYVDADRASHGQAQAAPQPSPTSQGDALDAARLDWLESQSQVNIERVRYLGADTTIYEVTSFNSTDYNGETLRKAIDAARAAHQKGETP